MVKSAKTLGEAEMGSSEANSINGPVPLPSERIRGSGTIYYGTSDIRDVQLRSLRRALSVVQQEPQLLSCTILENVVSGLTAHQADMSNRGAKVLILDEATSALSSEVELRIRDYLQMEQLRTGMTIVSIAHRLQLAKLADKIIVLNKGRVESDADSFEDLSKGARASTPFYRTRAFRRSA